MNGSCLGARTTKANQGITTLFTNPLPSATDRVEEPAKTVTLVKEVQHDAEGKHLAEEHAGVAATGVMGALHQPHHVPEHTNTHYQLNHSHSMYLKTHQHTLPAHSHPDDVPQHPNTHYQLTHIQTMYLNTPAHITSSLTSRSCT